MRPQTYIALASVLLCTIITVTAHSGRTDANGGHWNRKTGEYHYHSGENSQKSTSRSYNSDKDEDKSDGYLTFAERLEKSNERKQAVEEKFNREHPEYQQNSNSNSTSSSSSLPSLELDKSVYEPFTYVTEPPEPLDKQNTKNDDVDDDTPLWLKIVAIIILTSPIWMRIVGEILELCDEHSPKNNLKKYNSALCEFSNTLDELDTLKSKKSILIKLSTIPSGTIIGIDGLPKQEGGVLWGKMYTVYKSKKGSKIHSVSGCCNAYYRKHVYDYKNVLKDRKCLCRLCCADYKIPDFAWYENRLKLNSLQNEISEKQYKLSEQYSKVLECKSNCERPIVKSMISKSNKNQTLYEIYNERLNNDIKRYKSDDDSY